MDQGNHLSDARYKRMLSLIGQSGSREAAADVFTSLVFRPGGTPGSNVFVTPSALKAALLALDPSTYKTIVLDDSRAPAHLTVAESPWPLDNTTFWGNAAANETLIIDDGATFTSTSLTVANGCIIDSHSNTSPWTTTGFFGLYLVNPNSTFKSSTATAAFSVTAAGTGGSVEVGSGSILGDGTHPAITTAAGQSCFVFSVHGGSVVNAHALAGLGTNVLAYTADAPGTSLVQDVATLTLAFNGTDNFQQAAANTGSGSGTTSAVTANIAQRLSGKVSVRGLATGTVSVASTTVTVSLLRDALPILTLPPLTEVSTASFAIPIDFIDTLPDTGNHTYSVKAVAAAGTIAAGAGGNTIQAQEL